MQVRDGNRSGRLAGLVTGWVEILQPVGQVGRNTGQVFFSCYLKTSEHQSKYT